jgi:hypothetical protein
MEEKEEPRLTNRLKIELIRRKKKKSHRRGGTSTSSYVWAVPRPTSNPAA